MKNYLLFISIFCLFLPQVKGQIREGGAVDSLTLRISEGAFLTYYTADTATTPLWQIGRTHKTTFTTDTNGVISLMTDTVNSYPVNCNNSFVLTFPTPSNLIVGFWHRYQTDTGHDGGVVEYSINDGVSWLNLKGACNGDGGAAGTRTENFYAATDTLVTGQPAFSGRRSRFSRFQFFIGEPVKPSGVTASCGFFVPHVLVRFRFISDTSLDTLDGWMIDSIKIEHDFFSTGNVKNTVNDAFPSPFPNPSVNGVFNFPALKDEELYTIAIYNVNGQKLMHFPYRQKVDLSAYPPGLYHYRVSDSRTFYSGTLLFDSR